MESDTKAEKCSVNQGGRKELFQLFERLSIESNTIEHPEVFTVEAMMPHLEGITGAVVKNLFLRDKKKKLWLLTCHHDRQIDLKDVAKKIGAPGSLRFADEPVLLEKLGVAQGCVTPFALFNDKGHDVTFVLDSDLAKGNHEKVYGHPMTNAASTGVSPEDFLKFAREIGHEPVLIDF